MIGLLGGVALYFALSLLIGFVRGYADRKWPCTCGRARRFYFRSRHEAAWLMLFDAVAVSSIAALAAYRVATDGGAGDAVNFILCALPAAYFWRGWWLHEQGKIKRAAKSAGRVVINSHGRLTVDHT